MHELLLIKTLVFLVLILLGLYFTFLLAKKRLGPMHLKDGKIKIIEHKKLDARASIILLEIEQEKFIVVLNSAALSINKLKKG